MVDLNPVLTAANLGLAVRDTFGSIGTAVVDIVPDFATGDVLVRWQGVAGQVEALFVPNNANWNALFPEFVSRCTAASSRRTIELVAGWFPTTAEADQLLGQSGAGWRLMGALAAWDAAVLEYLVVNVLWPSGERITAEDPAILALPWWPS